MIVSPNERYEAQIFKLKPNSSFEYESVPYATFRCRPATQSEVKRYRIQQGVEGNSDSTYVFASNLPEKVNPRDRVKFQGKIWSVESVGYYYENNRLVSPNLMSEEYVASRCPKGIAIH